MAAAITLEDFLSLHQENGCLTELISVFQLPYISSEFRFTDLYFEDEHKKNIFSSDHFDVIGKKLVDHFMFHDDGTGESYFYIFLQEDNLNDKTTT